MEGHKEGRLAAMSRYDYKGFDDNSNSSIGLSGCKVEFEPVEGKDGTTWIVKRVTSWSGHNYIKAIRLQDALQCEVFGLDEDAARFVAEWCPECAGVACQELTYWPYNDFSIRQITAESCPHFAIFIHFWILINC